MHIALFALFSSAFISAHTPSEWDDNVYSGVSTGPAYYLVDND